MAEIAREYEKKETLEEMVPSRVRWENWEKLRREAVGFVKQEIRRWRWRRGRGGLLPEGYDAEGIANQVIAELLAGKGRVALGFTRERVVAELKRLARDDTHASRSYPTFVT